MQTEEQADKNTSHSDELFDLLTEEGKPTGRRKERKKVHRDGDWHKAVHVWILVKPTEEVLVQRRADWKDSWPGRWDISSAGHVEAGSSEIDAAQRELKEELGLQLPLSAFLPAFVYKQSYKNTFHGKPFINNEFDYVYLVVLSEAIPTSAYRLQEEEVQEVKYMHYKEVQRSLREKDEAFVDAYSVDGKYEQLFQLIDGIYSEDKDTGTNTVGTGTGGQGNHQNRDRTRQSILSNTEIIQQNSVSFYTKVVDLVD